MDKTQIPQSSQSSQSSEDSSQSSTGDKIYSGLASFGKTWSKIMLVFAVIFGTLFIILGIYTLFRKITTKVSGTITGIPQGGCGNSCEITVNFPWNGTAITENTTYSSNIPPVVGHTIDIYVIWNNPKSIQLQDIPQWYSFAFIVMGIIMMVASYFWYWASKKYKPVAAYEGLRGAGSILSEGAKIFTGGKW